MNRVRKHVVVAVGAAALMAGGLLSAQTASAAAGFGLFQNGSYGGCAYYGQAATNIAHFGSTRYNDRDASGSYTSCHKLFIGDRTSSVTNGTSCTMRLFVDASYKGSYQDFKAHSQSTSVKYNDKYSSVKFYC